MKYLSYRLSAAMWARVLLLWLVLAIGALVLGGVSIGLGQFVHNNITDELESQDISFPEEEGLTDEERAIDGLEENAGEQVLTGNQAKIYSEMIALHASESAERAGYPGATYASLGTIQRQLRADVAAATEAGDEEAIEAANTELTNVTNLRNTLLTASNLRGNLLSAYGWDNVSTGAIVTGVLIIVLSLVFFGLFFFELRRGHLPPVEA